MLFLIFSLILATPNAFAALCSKPLKGVPCTPNPNNKTKDAKKKILVLIADAQSMRMNIKKLRTGYIAVNNNPQASPEEKLAAFMPYYTKKTAQDKLYKEAMDKTELLYHVEPRNKRLTIGRPSDPVLGYVSGLDAHWNPQATDSGPDVLLAIKIKGSDGLDHYSGGVMDPNQNNGRQAVIFEDGRVVILEDSFNTVLKDKNPGFLAHLLYHESRHFNQLSRESLDGSKERRGWASDEEEEKDAYKADVAMASVFGLSVEQTAGLKGLLRHYEEKVANGDMTRLKADPRKENLRREYYELRQINLEAVYEFLEKAVKAKGRFGFTNGVKEQSAAELRRNHEKPDSTKPVIKLKRKIAGTEIKNGSFNEHEMIAEGTDEVGGTGIAKIIITQTSFKGTFSSTATFNSRNLTEQTTYSGMTTGDYAVWAVDFAGNESEPTRLTLDFIAPMAPTIVMDTIP